jgi:hypothetical protein
VKYNGSGGASRALAKPICVGKAKLAINITPTFITAKRTAFSLDVVSILQVYITTI